jgi:phage-related protein
MQRIFFLLSGICSAGCAVRAVRAVTIGQVIGAVLDHVAHAVDTVFNDISGCTGTIINRIQRIITNMLDILSYVVQLVGYGTVIIRVVVGVIDSVIHERISGFGIFGVRVDIVCCIIAAPGECTYAACQQTDQT